MKNITKVTISCNGNILFISEDLHSNDGIDEEEHGYEQNDVRKSLEGRLGLLCDQ